MKMKLVIILAAIFICNVTISAQKNLTLEESKQLALKNNAQTKNSGLEIEASRQIQKAAFTTYFPVVSSLGFALRAKDNLVEMKTAGGNLPVYDGNPANLFTATNFAYMPPSTIGMLEKLNLGTFSITQPVFAGGRIINGNKLAGLGADVSTKQNKLAQNDVLYKTEEQYWLVVSLESKMKTVVKYETMLENLLARVEDGYKSGLVTKNDVLKVKLKKNEVLLNKSKLDNGKKLALMAFCQYVGIPYDSTLVLKDTLPAAVVPESFFVDNKDALSRRAEYSLLQSSVEAEKLQTQIKLGEYLPQVGIGVSGAYFKLDKTDSRTVSMAFASVQIPISGWWEASYKLSERSIREQIAENNFKDKSELLLLQMQKSWQDLTDAYKQYQLNVLSKEQSEENLKVNEDSYKNGISNLSDLLEAQAMYQQTDDQLTDAKKDYKLKTVNYLIVTGRF